MSRLSAKSKEWLVLLHPYSNIFSRTPKCSTTRFQTLDSKAAKKINFQVMEDMVRDLVAEENPGVVETERAMIVKKNSVK